MTWILEDTPERMVVRLGALFPHSAICVLDKERGRARFYRRLFFFPRRMIDVWGDPDYDFAQNKPERLLMAGLDYCVQRYVLYVAAKPPRSIFRSIAAHLNRRIVYIPIGALNPAKLKKIRVVHVLDSYERRDEAKEYLW